MFYGFYNTYIIRLIHLSVYIILGAILKIFLCYWLMTKQIVRVVFEQNKKRQKNHRVFNVHQYVNVQYN